MRNTVSHCIQLRSFFLSIHSIPSGRSDGVHSSAPLLSNASQERIYLKSWPRNDLFAGSLSHLINFLECVFCTPCLRAFLARLCPLNLCAFNSINNLGSYCYGLVSRFPRIECAQMHRIRNCPMCVVCDAAQMQAQRVDRRRTRRDTERRNNEPESKSR